MKKLYSFLTISLMTLSVSYGQLGCNGGPPEEVNFDSGVTPVNYWVQIDTASNPNNIWQIGSPQKAVIDSAQSAPNVIITDTVNSYPPNDTSVFILGHLSEWATEFDFAGYYNVNTDSLHDNGTMEVSFNQGATWINLITDTIYDSYYSWGSPKPTLTGNSNGWQFFVVYLSALQAQFNVNGGDSILIRFTFISDAIANIFDGLAFDSFQFCDYIEGIEEVLNDNLIVVYPNPTNNLLFINRKTQPQKESVKIFNYTGQLLFDDENFKGKFVDTKKLNLTNGFYFLRYSDTKSYAMKKVIVQH